MSSSQGLDLLAVITYRLARPKGKKKVDPFIEIERHFPLDTGHHVIIEWARQEAKDLLKSGKALYIVDAQLFEPNDKFLINLLTFEEMDPSKKKS